MTQEEFDLARDELLSEKQETNQQLMEKTKEERGLWDEAKYQYNQQVAQPIREATGGYDELKTPFYQPDEVITPRGEKIRTSSSLVNSATRKDLLREMDDLLEQGKRNNPNDPSFYTKYDDNRNLIKQGTAGIGVDERYVNDGLANEWNDTSEVHSQNARLAEAKLNGNLETRKQRLILNPKDGALVGVDGSGGTEVRENDGLERDLQDYKQYGYLRDFDDDMLDEPSLNMKRKILDEDKYRLNNPMSREDLITNMDKMDDKHFFKSLEKIDSDNTIDGAYSEKQMMKSERWKRLSETLSDYFDLSTSHLKPRELVGEMAQITNKIDDGLFNLVAMSKEKPEVREALGKALLMYQATGLDTNQFARGVVNTLLDTTTWATGGAGALAKIAGKGAIKEGLKLGAKELIKGSAKSAMTSGALYNMGQDAVTQQIENEGNGKDFNTARTITAGVFGAAFGGAMSKGMEKLVNGLSKNVKDGVITEEQAIEIAKNNADGEEGYVPKKRVRAGTEKVDEEEDYVPRKRIRGQSREEYMAKEKEEVGDTENIKDMTEDEIKVYERKKETRDAEDVNIEKKASRKLEDKQEKIDNDEKVVDINDEIEARREVLNTSSQTKNIPKYKTDILKKELATLYVEQGMSVKKARKKVDKETLDIEVSKEAKKMSEPEVEESIGYLRRGIETEKSTKEIANSVNVLEKKLGEANVRNKEKVARKIYDDLIASSENGNSITKKMNASKNAKLKTMARENTEKIETEKENTEQIKYESLKKTNEIEDENLKTIREKNELEIKNIENKVWENDKEISFLEGDKGASATKNAVEKKARGKNLSKEQIDKVKEAIQKDSRERTGEKFNEKTLSKIVGRWLQDYNLKNDLVYKESGEGFEPHMITPIVEKKIAYDNKKYNNMLDAISEKGKREVLNPEDRKRAMDIIEKNMTEEELSQLVMANNKRFRIEKNDNDNKNTREWKNQIEEYVRRIRQKNKNNKVLQKKEIERQRTEKEKEVIEQGELKSDKEYNEESTKLMIAKEDMVNAGERAIIDKIVKSDQSITKLRQIRDKIRENELDLATTQRENDVSNMNNKIKTINKLLEEEFYRRKVNIDLLRERQKKMKKGIDALAERVKGVQKKKIEWTKSFFVNKKGKRIENKEIMDEMDFISRQLVTVEDFVNPKHRGENIGEKIPEPTIKRMMQEYEIGHIDRGYSEHSGLQVQGKIKEPFIVEGDTIRVNTLKDIDKELELRLQYFDSKENMKQVYGKSNQAFGMTTKEIRDLRNRSNSTRQANKYIFTIDSLYRMKTYANKTGKDIIGNKIKMLKDKEVVNYVFSKELREKIDKDLYENVNIHKQSIKAQKRRREELDKRYDYHKEKNINNREKQSVKQIIASNKSIKNELEQKIEKNDIESRKAYEEIVRGEASKGKSWDGEITKEIEGKYGDDARMIQHQRDRIFELKQFNNHKMTYDNIKFNEGQRITREIDATMKTKFDSRLDEIAEAERIANEFRGIENSTKIELDTLENLERIEKEKRKDSSIEGEESKRQEEVKASRFRYKTSLDQVSQYWDTGEIPRIKGDDYGTQGNQQLSNEVVKLIDEVKKTNANITKKDIAEWLSPNGVDNETSKRLKTIKKEFISQKLRKAQNEKLGIKDNEMMGEKRTYSYRTTIKDLSNSALQVLGTLLKNKKLLALAKSGGENGDIRQKIGENMMKHMPEGSFVSHNPEFKTPKDFIKPLFMTEIYGRLRKGQMQELMAVHRWDEKQARNFFDAYEKEMNNLDPTLKKTIDAIYARLEHPEKGSKIEFELPNGYKIELDYAKDYKQKVKYKGKDIDFEVKGQELDEYNRGLFPAILHSVDGYVAHRLREKGYHTVHDAVYIPSGKNKKMDEEYYKIMDELAEDDIFEKILKDIGIDPETVPIAKKGEKDFMDKGYWINGEKKKSVGVEHEKDVELEIEGNAVNKEKFQNEEGVMREFMARNDHRQLSEDKLLDFIIDQGQYDKVVRTMHTKENPFERAYNMALRNPKWNKSMAIKPPRKNWTTVEKDKWFYIQKKLFKEARAKIEMNPRYDEMVLGKRTFFDKNHNPIQSLQKSREDVIDRQKELFDKDMTQSSALLKKFFNENGGDFDSFKKKVENWDDKKVLNETEKEAIDLLYNTEREASIVEVKDIKTKEEERREVKKEEKEKLTKVEVLGKRAKRRVRKK